MKYNFKGAFISYIDIVKMFNWITINIYTYFIFNIGVYLMINNYN